MGILDIFKRKTNTATDPVCHMQVDIATVRWTSDYESETYYFCAPGCKHVFDEDPPKYIGSETPAVEM